MVSVSGRAPAQPFTLSEAVAEPGGLDISPAASATESDPAEQNDAAFPLHMLRWTIVGIVAYVAIIATAMIYAALLSPAAFR
jgi:hypothetical protein